MQAIAAAIVVLQAATTIAGLPTNLIFLLLAIEIAVSIAFVLTLSRTLEKCSPPSRTMGTGSLWLLVIPIVNRFYIFTVASNMAKSLSNEFRARGIPSAEAEPGKKAGTTMGVVGLAIIAVDIVIPSVSNFANLMYAVTYGLYWAKINGFSRLLDKVPAPGSEYPVPGFPAAGPPGWPQGYAPGVAPQGYAPGVQQQGYAPGVPQQGYAPGVAPQSSAPVAGPPAPAPGTWPQGPPPGTWPQR